MKNMIPIDDAMLGLYRVVDYFNCPEKAKLALDVLGALDANNDSTISMIDLAEVIGMDEDVFEQYVEEALKKEEADRHRLLDDAAEQRMKDIKFANEQRQKVYFAPFKKREEK